MSVSIRLRRDTSVLWGKNDPVLHQGELGFATDLKRVKVGDGFNEWSKLPYLNDADLDTIRNEYGNETDFIIALELAK